MNLLSIVAYEPLQTSKNNSNNIQHHQPASIQVDPVTNAGVLSSHRSLVCADQSLHPIVCTGCVVLKQKQKNRLLYSFKHNQILLYCIIAISMICYRNSELDCYN